LRCGEHLLHAGDYVPAYDLLLEAEELARLQGDDLGAERALELARQAAEGFTDKGAMQRHVKLEARRTDGLRIRGAWEEASRAARSLQERAEEVGDQKSVALALRIQGQCAFERGHLDEASQAVVQAQSVAQACKDRQQVTRCELLLGNIAGVRSDWDQALMFYDAARQRITKHFKADDELQGESLYYVAAVHQQQGDLSKALPMLIQSLKHWERCGGQRGMAYVANALADAARTQGRMDRAKDWYRRAKKVHESVGAWEMWLVRLNLALVLMLEEHFDEAQKELEGCVERFRQSDQKSFLAASQVFCLPNLARNRDWRVFDAYAEEAMGILRTQKFADADLATVYEIAGSCAAAESERRRADDAYAMAAEQWRFLGRMAEANAASLRIGVD
jgi:tetratricopeptide (TPR) repeat protein